MGQVKAKAPRNKPEPSPEDAATEVQESRQVVEPAPLPWAVKGYNKDRICTRADVQADIVCFAPHEQWESHAHWSANAELICRAVNSHEKLLALARAVSTGGVGMTKMRDMARVALIEAGEGV